MDENPAAQEPPEESSTLIHERVIQPSAAMIEEMSQQAKAEPARPSPAPAPAAVPPQAAQTPAPQPPAAASAAPPPPTYPVATHGMAASAAPPAAAGTAPSQAGDYNPSSQKVSERAPSLKLFALVVLILSALVLVTVLQTLQAFWAIHKIAGLAHQDTSLSFPLLVSIVTAALPLAASIIFLVGKNITLVKALLIVLLINYATGIADTIFVMFSKHVSLSSGYIVGFVVDLGFALWAWSVFTEVNALATK